MKITAKQFGRVNKNGEQPICIRLYHNAERSYIDTGLSVKPDFFDERAGKIVNHPNSTFMVDANSSLASQIAKCDKAIKLLGDHINEVNITKLKHLVLSYSESNGVACIGNSDFYEMAAIIITELEIEGRTGHAENINSTISILQSYYGKSRCLPFDVITVDFLKSFRRWYVPAHGKQVTFNKHLRNMKLIFNEARRKKMITRDIYPFDDYAIPTDYDAEIRCHDAGTIFKISQLEGLGRDMFMLTFYLCGMNMADITSIS